MLFEISLKIENLKNVFSFSRAAASFLGPRPKPAQPAAAPAARTPRVRPSPARVSGLRCAKPVPARRARPRQATLAAWPPCAGEARRATATACLTLHARAFFCPTTLPPPHSSSFSLQFRAPRELSPPSAAAALPATYPFHASIPRFPPPAAPPSLPASLALACGRRRRGKGRAWPPSSSSASALPRP